MICAQQKIVFAARARKHRGEFGVTSRPAKRHDAADHPEQDQREAGIDRLDLKAEAGENADANHVGDDDCCGRERRNARPNTIAEVRAGQPQLPRHSCMYRKIHPTISVLKNRVPDIVAPVEERHTSAARMAISLRLIPAALGRMCKRKV